MWLCVCVHMTMSSGLWLITYRVTLYKLWSPSLHRHRLVHVNMKILAVLLCLTSGALARHELYESYKSYYVAVESREQQQALASLAEQFSVDVLSPPLLQREGVVLVAPEHQQGFTQALREQSIQYRVHRDDVKAALEYDDIVTEEYRASTRAMNGGKNFIFDYRPYPDIMEFMEGIASRHPDIAKLVTPANSFEGRPIQYLKISTTDFQNASKPVIFIDGGIHAREWISPPSVLYAIYKLLEDSTTARDLINDFDWILLPVVNPDGYAFTFTNNGRFWRKTRSTTFLSTCPGVDGNRNYDFAWGTVGSSPLPCADTYPGSSAFSEVETRVVRNIILEYLPRMPLFLTMHSYGSMILYPWGHDGTLPPNALILHAAGVAQAAAMDPRQHQSFPRYVVGNSLLVIGYGASGAAEDYAHSVGVPLAYTYELPGLSGGLQGFHLPPQWIERVVDETWHGIVAGVRQANAFYPRR